MSYFLEPYASKNKLELKLGLCNYATISDLKKRSRC